MIIDTKLSENRRELIVVGESHKISGKNGKRKEGSVPTPEHKSDGRKHTNSKNEFITYFQNVLHELVMHSNNR